MNPFPAYQFTQPRDKTKSYFQPSSQNPFSTSQVHSESSTLSQHQNSSSSFNQSDKYKSYYTEYQDYRSSSVSEIQKAQDNNISARGSKMSEGEGMRNGKFIGEARNGKFIGDGSNRFNNLYSDSNKSSGSFFDISSNYPHHNEKSQQRKRFYTVTQHQKPSFTSSSTPFNNMHQQTFSHSMILNRPSSFIKQQTDPKKDLYKYVNEKFAASREQKFENSRDQRFENSRVESQNNSREKREGNSISNRRIDYLEKGNKKVSLKRDIARISPKYQENSEMKKYPPAHHSFVSISNKFNINPSNKFNINNNHNTNPHPHNTNSLQQSHQTPTLFPQPSPSTTSFAHSVPTQQDMIFPSTLQRFSLSLSENSTDQDRNNNNDNNNHNKSQKNRENINQGKPVSFKKNSKTEISTYNAERPVMGHDGDKSTPQSQSSGVNQSNKMADSQNIINNPSQVSTQKSQVSTQKSQVSTQKYFGSIRSNTVLTKPPSSSSSSHQLIDQQLYTDMKISRIQQSTSHLQQKISSLYTQLNVLLHQSRQHQTSISSINQYITKQQEQGITPQDIKRIKKELKIMKTNFQTAFTSMTDQINRKLIKEENIMKSLSDEIRLVAEENHKLNETIERKTRKVDSLEKSMTSFMRENQQRMENLVLNESFSSSKRSKNHSFQYGLDLKNMSSDQNYNSAKSYNSNVENNITMKKLQSIEKEIKKMKVFHIQEQQNYQLKFLEVKQQVDRVTNQQGKSVLRSEAQHMIRETVDEVLEQRLQNWAMVYNQKQEKQAERFKQELDSLKSRIQQLTKTCHQQLYDYRLSKLHQPPVTNFVTQSKIKTINNEFQQQLGDLQAQQRSMLMTLTQFQQKLASLEDRQHGIVKNFQDQKLKELKLVGDLREQQTAIKKVNQVISEMKDVNQVISGVMMWKSNQEILNKEMGLFCTTNKTLIIDLENRLNEIDRINAIQTENIESINNEFERVINKEIIPKFGEINHLTFEINQKIHSLSTDVTFIKKINDTSMNLHNSFNIDSPRFIGDPKELEKKIDQFFEKNMQKFTKQKVKLISTKLISSKSPLSKIGLFKDKKNSDSLLQNNLFKKNSSFEDLQIGKEETYLLDEDGYLMDWEGVYLMEVDEFGGRKKIKVTEEELYFMEVNGLEIRKPGQVVN